SCPDWSTQRPAMRSIRRKSRLKPLFENNALGKGVILPVQERYMMGQRNREGTMLEAGIQPRRQSVAVKVGKVTVGGGAPVVVQSMTNTDTADVDSTVRQVAALANAGSEIVRITVDRDEAAAAVPKIKERLLKIGCDVPIVGDFHYIGHKLLADHSG